MGVKLTKSDLDEMSEAAADIEDNAKTAKNHISETSTPDMEGFQTKSAIVEVRDLFKDKADKCASRWEHFSAALEETGANVSDQDDANSFHLNVDVGDAD